MKKVVEEIVAHFKNANPEYCQYLGVSETYGKIKSYSSETINNRIKELKIEIEKLNELLELKNFQSYREIELEAIQIKLKSELFELEEECEYKENPVIYFTPLQSIESYYISRSYAPLEQRINHIIATEQAFPRLIAEANIQLHKTLPRAKVEVAIIMGKSLVAYLKDELIEEILKVNNNELIEEWSQINVVVLDSLDSFLKKLQEVYLPVCKNDFALGEEMYLQKIKKTEGITLPVKKLLEVAERDLVENYNKLQEIKRNLGEKKFLKLAEEAPKEDELLKTAEGIIKNAKEFVKEKNLITIPEMEDCKVKETPKSRRVVVLAAMNTANIAEDSKAKESFYYVTPPDKTWSVEEKKNYLKTFNKGAFELITIHEVFPGHYLHMQHIRKLTPIMRLFRYSTAMLEGWAHYTEELAIEQGYDKIDKTQAHIGQLFGALMRNCRFVASIKMHCFGMTVEEAKKLFIEKGMMAEKAALMEARRGTINPMYINYTLGKLMIKKLREDYKQEKGVNFNLKEFHNELLSYGGVPLSLSRKKILKNPGTNEDIL